LGCTLELILDAIAKARQRDPSPTKSLKRFDSTIRGMRRDQLGGELPVTSDDVEAVTSGVVEAVGSRVSVMGREAWAGNDRRHGGTGNGAPSRPPAIMEPPVNRFAAAHGDYGPDQVVDLGNELGDGRGRIHQVVRNRGGTTVERWLNAGSLTSGQAEAISLYARAWHMFIGEQRITANWGLCSFIRGMPASDWVQTQVEAKELILHIDEAIFKAMPPKYVDVWKNIVIFDKSADGAGREMLSGSSARSADVGQSRSCCSSPT
jgi:hypothetical protein